MATPDEMKGAAVFLASEDSAAIHRAAVMVSAGWSAWQRSFRGDHMMIWRFRGYNEQL
jgi:hypothetical protein